jgi:hypothetical protein
MVVCSENEMNVILSIYICSTEELEFGEAVLMSEERRLDFPDSEEHTDGSENVFLKKRSDRHQHLILSLRCV